MADAKKTAEPENTTPQKPKSKLLLLIVIGILAGAIAAGAAFFLLQKNDGGEGAHPAEKKKIEAGVPPVFYRFEKPFTVKLQTEQQDAYLQTEIQLRLQDAHDQELIKQYEPELKYRITLALMERKASDLGNAAGVQKLATELRDIANNVIVPPAPPTHSPAVAGAAEPAPAAAANGPVQSVLFSTFIIQ